MSEMSDRVRASIALIDEKTDELLEIADVLEERQVNVNLGNGRYLNPVSAIRAKVDVIWDEAQAIAATLGQPCTEKHRVAEAIAAFLGIDAGQINMDSEAFGNAVRIMGGKAVGA